ncbi:preprotein translocase subunit YajC [Haloferula luteola]|uniref:Sec translocon accessory complex subunit YajC n=1 Tax=Haloferula luteola TaxID=595692 RepID=A0A840V6W8_9BACT|nr:preprotein translocase subunit YajC [Haloferula luteola]MBB5350498.1 preprotein translocase subunit YajC [Haloferula luteola]
MITLLALQFLAQNPAPKGLGNPLVMMVLMIVMFYFLLIRPQQKQRKDLQKRIDALKTGDRVITTAGIHALVHHIKDKTVTLKIAEGVLVEFDKQAIASVQKKDAPAADTKAVESK